ncbi:MAG TPA: hypothetical protein VJ917_10575 [Saprospiraceae bacterium]|nr:hypothetical protein [Saprospiraceae bacterium]
MDFWGMIKKFILGLLALLSLLLGVNIYTDFRSMGTKAFYQINDFIPIDLQEWLPGMVESEFFLYNLPDLLWMYAFLLMIPLIWGFKFSKEMIFWASSVVFLGFGFELLQYWDLVPGTFDWMDMTGLTMALFISYLTFFVLKMNL